MSRVLSISSSALLILLCSPLMPSRTSALLMLVALLFRSLSISFAHAFTSSFVPRSCKNPRGVTTACCISCMVGLLSATLHATLHLHPELLLCLWGSLSFYQGREIGQKEEPC